jgi:hypothetical protein
MSWLTQLFSGGIDKVVSSVGEAADRLITSDEERGKLKNELALIEAKATLDAQKNAQDAEAKLESEITERWKSDNQQDDPWAKRVRPFSLVYLLGVMSFMIFVDSTEYFNFDVKASYIDLIQTLLVTVFVAYFGSRGIEKVAAIRKK